MIRTFFLLSALLVAIANAAITEEAGVLVLGDDNFEEATTKHSAMLVEFYAPWCGHCKSLAPEWNKAAKTLADSTVKLAKVDATEHKDLASQFEIRGFPTIKYIKNGKTSDYTGGRTESEIVQWVNKKAGPPAVTISSEDDLNKFQEKHEVFVLGSFSSIESEAAKKFVALADSDEDHVFAISTEESVKSKLALTEDTVVVLKSFDNLRSDMSVASGFNAEDVTAFVDGESVPLIQEFTPESSKKIFGSKVTRHVLFFTDKSADHHAATIAAYTAAAPAFKGQVMFINVPSSENKIMEYFGIVKSQLPTMVLADLSSQDAGIKKYPYTGASESEAISAHVNSFLKGELKPTLKSEEPAPEDTTGDVVVVKGTSFDDIVINNNKDVLVEFYAPWCGHCKKLAPIWDELGSRMSKSNVVIAKMDATANEVDVPGMSVKGFPTIYFFKGDAKDKPVKYDGARELEDFVKYLETNAHNKVAGKEEL